MTGDDVRKLLEVVKEPLLVVAPNGEILLANRAALTLSPTLAPGSSLTDALEEGAERTRTLLATWLRHGETVPGRMTVRGPQGGVRCRTDACRVELSQGPAVIVHASPETSPFAQLNDQLRRLQHEVTYRSALERQRDEALHREQEARARVERLHGLTSALAGALTIDDVVRAMRLHVPSATGTGEAVVVLAGEPAWGSDQAGVATPASADRTVTGDVSGPFSDALAAASALFFDSVDDLRRRYGREAGSADDAYLAAVVPLTTIDGKPLGLLGLRQRPPGGLGDEQRSLARVVAAQCGQALERARLHDKDRRFAETLQRALLPRRLPEIGGMAVAVRYLPASERTAVGGDWYDVIDLGRDTVALVVGDVAGHGQGAATAMAEMRSALRGLASSYVTPAAVVTAFNRFVCRQMPAEMATVLYLVADLGAGRLSYAKAGHLPPLVVEGSSATFLRGALGPPLGIAPDVEYEEADYRLGHPWRVIAYTDGLVERRDEPIDFGLRRLSEASTMALEGADAICAHVIASLVGGADLSDDAAILVATGSVRTGERGDEASAGREQRTADEPGARRARRQRPHGGGAGLSARSRPAALSRPHRVRPG